MANPKSKFYPRTDLATECRAREGASLESFDGIDFTEENLNEITVSHLIISTDKASQIIGKPIGRYTTIGFTNPTIMTDEQIKDLENTLCLCIKNFIYRLVPNCRRVLAVGLGNSDVTADSIGPRCISSITVTRHLKEEEPEIFKRLCHLETSAVIPGVLGQTGFESAGLISSAVNLAKPDVVIVTDALAARCPSRLTCTIQLCDSGISPGSGIKNHRTPINRELLGVPVIAIGVPTVVDASTIIFTALENAGITELSPELEAELKKNQNFFVSPKDIDHSVKLLCSVISNAINSALSI